jgi:Putative zinc-finger
MSGQVLQFDSAEHKVADVLLPWFVNETLEGEELAFVQEHLAQCERCRHEVEWLREFHAACAAAAAIPQSSSAVRHLRRRLEEPRRGRGITALLYAHWRRIRPWSRAVMAAQLAAILALGTVVVIGDDRPAVYRTLGADNAGGPVTGTFVVVFDPAATELDLRRMLRAVGARIVDGPTQANTYLLEVPANRREQAVRALKADRLVVLVESLDPGADR